MYFVDTETCGLHGPTVLIQYAQDDGEIILHSVWHSPISETIELIEAFVEEGICGFNLAFDWFHLCQTYTTLISLPDPRRHPIDCIEEYALAEDKARWGPCLKPAHALDLMLHARKGPYQSTMDRNDIRIKKVPTALAWELARELDSRIPLNDVYFARRKDKSVRWQVQDRHDDFGDVEPEFKDVVLKFAPSSALKALAQDALGIETESIKLFADVEPPPKAMPVELGYAPFALAIGEPGNWRGAWPDVVHMHASHWTYNSLARAYASDDVKYTRMLYEYFKKPEPDDIDSILACMVGAVRWHGFRIDVEGLKNLRVKSEEKLHQFEFNFNSPAVCRKYLEEVMSETEKLTMRVGGKITTKAPILEEVSRWNKEDICPKCEGMGCNNCREGLLESGEPHPAALRAQDILAARHAQKEIELYDKLIRAGRFHASFNVIGTRSSRMSGGDDLNAQGIKRTKEVRACFLLADPDYILCGGDFAGFEVVLADAVYGDPDLRIDLLSGKKIHGLFGMFLFPGMAYDEILATSGLPDEADKYIRSKNGVFAMLYGGEAYTLQTRVGITEEAANVAYQAWINKYKVWGMRRKETFDKFCSMRQPGGIGTKVEWHEPADYVESIFGFKRYFTLENQICKTLFTLAEDPPKHWQQIKINVVRRDRVQSASGACRSALFAAAFAMQAANMRAAANHEIQSSGAEITKMLQNDIWELQPEGINRWRVIPLNVHDEIECPALKEVVPLIKEKVDALVERLKAKVPLIAIDWSDKLKSWADK